MERTFAIGPHFLMAVSAGHVSNMDLFDATMNKPLDIANVAEALARVDARFSKQKQA